MNTPNLVGMTLEKLKLVASDAGLKPYAANQIASWLYKKFATDISQMTDISAKARLWLQQNYHIEWHEPISRQVSVDGTIKYLFRAGENRYVESVYIPEEDRKTLCVSSQVGCKMGCKFCMTAQQGFQQNLSAGEILNQLVSIPDRDQISNIVFMGMGEPMDNLQNVLDCLEILTSDYGFGWSYQRITVSSIGVMPAMQQFLEKSKCHLAISLHSPYDEERQELMPMQKIFPASKIINELKKWDFSHQRRISFEYIVFKSLNHSEAHAKALARLLQGLPCRVNLIRFHPIPDSPLQGASDAFLNAFCDSLNEKGITTTIRKSRGLDILAACGMLSTKEMQNKNDK